ncbi:serine protease [Streptomyces sp. F001]|uniref:trypsin-like peptidase domain-containing protein n=1 Tax=Streptomyces sp. F001 TaxID=1510026 RepID=UPI00101E40F2|nr:trypsin-like peptidase domain-containing protein [Streptomyces sp. F001]RZB16053.1 serine protease [Streptomyces sp. F001]
MRGPAEPHACAVWIAVGDTFKGSGFFVAEGVVATAAHVVSGAHAANITVGDASGSHKVAPEAIRAWPTHGGDSRFYPFPDLALLQVPERLGHPITHLVGADPEPGIAVTALGFSAETPTPGVQPDSLRLHVTGRSGEFGRILGDGIRPGFSGCMLLDAEGLTVGVLKASRDYHNDRGGWFVPVSALHAVLREAGYEPNLASRRPQPPSDAELVEALMVFPSLGRSEGRQDLLETMGRRLGLPYSFEVEERSGRREHLGRLVHRCRHYRDESAALRALYGAMAELVPHNGALDQLRLVVEGAVGGWNLDE